jgi:3-oxoacyl-[acyl-carrier-protein] synthase II
MTSNSKTRVVVTGMGAITCLGNSVEQFWTGVKNGQSGIRKISLVSPDGFPCSISGEIQDFDPTEHMDRKEARRMARFSQFAIVAADQAVEDSGLDFEQEDLDRVGVLIGSGSGGLPETDQQSEIRVKRGVGRMSPYYIPMMLVNMAAANISHRFNLTGYTNTCVTACAASTQAIGEAAEVIRRGDADIIVTGGTEAGICEIGMGGFSTMRALSTWSGDPSQASRPFDKGRDGFAPSEGSGILILESLEHAQARGASIYAEIGGWGVSSDAYHLVQPHPEGSGAAKAMNRALTNAGVTINDVDYINAHGTSTPINDASETKAIKAVFGEHAYNVPISSTKSMVGHSLGASGALEAIVCINSINDGVLHPTINQDEPDPDCDLDYIPNVSRELEVNVTLSNSFGFGGQNACLVIKKFA